MSTMHAFNVQAQKIHEIESFSLLTHSAPSICYCMCYVWFNTQDSQTVSYLYASVQILYLCFPTPFLQIFFQLKFHTRKLVPLQYLCTSSRKRFNLSHRNNDQRHRSGSNRFHHNLSTVERFISAYWAVGSCSKLRYNQ